MPWGQVSLLLQWGAGAGARGWVRWGGRVKLVQQGWKEYPTVCGDVQGSLLGAWHTEHLSLAVCGVWALKFAFVFDNFTEN